MEPGRLFSYKLKHDSGFAPNPWWGYLTLATCKPGIRRTKRVGDWIAGFTSGALCGDAVGEERLIYVMQASEVLAIAAYYRDPRFARKIPPKGATDRRLLLGDNIYAPLRERAVQSEDFRQVENVSHGPDGMDDDIRGINVLVATRFAYFGRDACHVPADVRPEVPNGQSAAGQRTHDQHRVTEFIEFVERRVGLEGAVLAPPHTWPDGNVDWRESKGACSVTRKRVPAAVPAVGHTPKRPRC